ncbi:hypothetical protein MJ585_06095 [Klebsiella pneumoniae]|nr:hypothetical protein MJ585_06095 [Klebsiella pneumoniae]
MKPKNGHPGIIQKTGGGGGFITYGDESAGQRYAFVVVTRSPLTRFNNMSDGINDLVSELRRTAQHADGQPVSPGKVSPMRHNDRFGETSRCHFSYTIVFHFTNQANHDRFNHSPPPPASIQHSCAPAEEGQHSFERPWCCRSLLKKKLMITKR